MERQYSPLMDIICTGFFVDFYGHNGILAAIFVKENLLDNVLSAIPQESSREE